MKERIEFNDGTVIQNAYVVMIDSTHVNVMLSGQHTQEEIDELFGNVERIRTFTSYQYGDVQKWTGYINVESTRIGEINSRVSLSK